MDYKTEITQEKVNQNKLWSLIFNQSNLKGWIVKNQIKNDTKKTQVNPD